MKIMNQVALVALFCGMTYSTTAQEVLRIGVEGAYPPFSEVSQSGEVVGFDVDMANALCEQMQRQCKMVQIDWDGLIPAVKSKKIHAIIASMSATEERKQNISFSEKYYQIPVKVIRKKGVDIAFDKVGMKGKTIGLQRSTTFDKNLTDLFGDVAEVKRYGSNDEVLIDLQAGRLDVVAAESLVLVDFLKTDVGKNFEFFGPDLVDPKYYGSGIAIGVDKGNEKLANEFSAAIKAIRDNGKYKTINDKYFDMDIYGNGQ